MLTSLVTSFLQGLGIVGLVAFAHEASLHLFRDPRARAASTAVVFAIGVVATMALPVRLGEGLGFDLRNAFLILSPIFGGISAAALTTIAAAAFRLHMGGVGAMAGLLGIVLAAGIGISASYYPRLLDRMWRGSALLGLSGCIPLVSIFALPNGLALPALADIALPYIIANIIGVSAAAMILRRRADAASREVMLTQQADTDRLTDLYNERAFDRMAPALIKRAALHHLPCAILMVHLDGMQTVNEHLGRNARDLALRDAAHIIAKAVPTGHLVARIGAKEFAILLLNRTQDQARIVAENIRIAVAAEDFDLAIGSARISVSIGVTPIPVGNDAFGEALTRVDAALQAAKRNGHNRVEVAQAA